MSIKQLLLLGMALLLIIFPLVLWLSIPKPIEIIALPVTLRVDSIYAFAITDEPILRLGTTTPGGGANRNFTITNAYSHDVRATVSYEGLEWLYLSENEVYLEPGQNKSINVRARVPDSAEHGEYEWTLIVRLFKS